MLGSPTDRENSKSELIHVDKLQSACLSAGGDMTRPVATRSRAWKQNTASGLFKKIITMKESGFTAHHTQCTLQMSV